MPSPSTSATELQHLRYITLLVEQLGKDLDKLSRQVTALQKKVDELTPRPTR